VSRPGGATLDHGIMMNMIIMFQPGSIVCNIFKFHMYVYYSTIGPMKKL